MVNLLPYKAGIDEARKKMADICRDPRSAFLTVLSDQGYQVPRALQIGKIERIDAPNERQGKKSGWYAYNEIEDNQASGNIIGIASYGSWKEDITQTWSSRSEHKMSVEERTNYQRAREQIRIALEEETKSKQLEASKTAHRIWNESIQATEHPYLTNKGIETTQGIKIAKDGRLIIPIAVNSEITSLQFINDNGDKRFLTGGKLKGGWFLIDGNTDTVYVAEGYSTAKSIAQATGNRVYVAFNAGNLYEVSSFVKENNINSRIIIAGDDDTESDGNVGRTKATQTADGLRLDVIFPDGFNDFNDMHKELGIKRLKDYLNPKNLKAYDNKKSKTMQESINYPIGALGDMANYYNATSGNNQFGFSIQTSLAICSLVLGRLFTTSRENYTPLYLLNVAKSGTGKEHTKTIIEKILDRVNLAYLIGGDGYTSAGAVFSTLLDRPKHISVIDEFGRYLEAGRDMGKGNLHQREANTKLMEAITRTHSIIRPPSYSSMTLKKDQADAIKNRLVYNPSITLMTMTTPETLFKSLDMGAIKDGFFNRFIVSISDAERTVRKHKPPMDVPDSIVNWIEAVLSRNDNPHIATEPAKPICLEFSEEAYAMQEEFQLYANVELPNQLEKYGMAELSGRSNEMAMKISLIYALSRDPYATVIEADDMKWSIDYVRQALDTTIKSLKVTLSHSEHEADKKEILADLRSRGSDGITWASMMKTPPYSQHKAKDLKDILSSLEDAELAGSEPYQNPNGGRPSLLWIALK